MAVRAFYKQEAPHKACDYQKNADNGADVNLRGELNANQGDTSPKKERGTVDGVVFRQGKIFQLFRSESLLSEI